MTSLAFMFGRCPSRLEDVDRELIFHRRSDAIAGLGDALGLVTRPAGRSSAFTRAGAALIPSDPRATEGGIASP